MTMNFSMKVKNELIGGAPRAKCCRRAYLHGLFFNTVQTRGGTLILSVLSADVRHEAMRLYREMFHKEALMDGNRLLFSSDALFRELTSKDCFLACEHCANHFMRGLLISAGSVTDPAKSYRLEIKVTDPEQLPLLTDFLNRNGWTPKCRSAADAIFAYYRQSDIIENILAFAGANQCVFELINTKITKEIRNTENRATNCVARNIKNAVNASARHCAAIALLRESGRFDALPEELRETALLRSEHPEASLAELAFLHNPTITKSGLNHRLQKILEFAEAQTKKTQIAGKETENGGFCSSSSAQ